MKITINGKVSTDALSLVLNEQKEKTKIIKEFCKKEKLNTFYYKDNELEYEYKEEIIKSAQIKNTSRQIPQTKKEVETR